MSEQDRVVRVTFRKQVSDGSYGTESAEVTLEDRLDEQDFNEKFGEDLVETLLMQARRQVHAELARSPSANVRRTVATPVPARAVPPGPAPDVDDEDPVFEGQPWR